MDISFDGQSETLRVVFDKKDPHESRAAAIRALGMYAKGNDTYSGSPDEVSHSLEVGKPFSALAASACIEMAFNGAFSTD